MKKIYTLIAFIGSFSFANAQMQGQLITGSLIASGSNSIMAVIKSSATYSGQLTNLQFTFQVPNTVSPQPTVTIKSNPLSTYIPTASYVTLISNENGFYNYLFSVVTVGSPKFNFIADQEINALEVTIDINPTLLSQVRLAQVPGGGASHQMNFYMEISGNDNTNINGMFYGDGAVNGGDYANYSYVPVNFRTVPVKLSSFTANAKNNEALLNWSVENQDANSSHFEIERSSDGTNFTQVGVVNATNNPKESYSYTDNNINLSGAVYYRLKMMDKDGQFAYSDIKTVQFGNAAFAVSVYPNPVQSITKLKVTLDQQQAIKVSISNALGNLVKRYEITGQKGINEKSIDLSEVPSGSYMIRIEAGQNRKTLSVIKN